MLGGGVPCYKGRTRLRVSDGEDGPEIWEVAAKMLNKQSQTAEKSGPLDLGLGRGLTTPHRKETLCYEMLCRNLIKSVILPVVLYGRAGGRAIVNTVMNLRYP
jgi:hypothetical protein